MKSNRPSVPRVMNTSVSAKLGESTSFTSLGEMPLTDNGFTYPQSDVGVEIILTLVKIMSTVV